SEILIRDARGAPLMNRDELAEACARLVHRSALDQSANLHRNPRVVRERCRHTATGPGADRPGGVGVGWVDGLGVKVATHSGITMPSGVCLQYKSVFCCY